MNLCVKRAEAPESLAEDLEAIASAARSGSGYAAAAAALETAAAWSGDDASRRRRLIMAAGCAQLAGDGGMVRQLVSAAGGAAGAPSPELPRRRFGAAWRLTNAGHTAQAQQLLRRTVDHLYRAGALHALGEALSVLAYASALAGDHKHATVAAAEATALSTMADDSLSLYQSACAVALVHAVRGDDGPCRTHVSQARTLAERSGVRPVAATRALALLEVGAGRHTAAESSGPDGTLMLDRPEAILRHGPVLAEVARLARNDAAPLPAASASRLLGMTGSEHGYDGNFRRALTLHRTIECPFDAARVRLCYGERLRRSGRRIEARQQLEAALTTFRRLDAAPWTDRTCRELDATTGIRTVSVGGRTQRLTPRELHVARAVATGMTNQQAAAALFISTKTVEFHLGNVYRKLGISTRGQLAHRFPRL